MRTDGTDSLKNRESRREGELCPECGRPTSAQIAVGPDTLHADCGHQFAGGGE